MSPSGVLGGPCRYFTGVRGGLENEDVTSVDGGLGDERSDHGGCVTVVDGENALAPDMDEWPGSLETVHGLNSDNDSTCIVAASTR
ncbi:uncharacterized protein IUM83_17375 [Phytophthora cinnamomi]|uniref:uncharacterized protein n=1 Tax=Phytophthora cinnamomi TaxID=4785 RepID=UPI003559E3F9|nr:hypothetical protein IUM83_17375 [Phytophthora cinnamomi]